MHMTTRIRSNWKRFPGLFARIFNNSLTFTSLKLAIITTHPIQYNAPLFRSLAGRNIISIKVFYTWGLAGSKPNYDPGFGKVIGWDMPLLEGYEFEFMNNIASDQGSHHFRGINNPDIIQKINEYRPGAILV